MSKLQAKECQTVEYKSTWHDKYLEWICGFANAQGAVMYIGVNDNHEVIGLDHIDKLMEDIPNKIVNSMGIVADVNLRKQDGLEYIEVAVAPSNVPVSYKGKYYYRSGSTMQELTGPALTDFLMRKMNTSWDMTTEPSATIDDIDPSAIKYFINAAIREGRINPSAKNDSVEQVLRRLHLINKENGKITIAALLLFGKDVERWNLTVAFRLGRFGVDQSDLIIQDRIVCPLIELPDRVIEVLKAKYLVSPISYKGMRRIERLEVPEDALREMLCNAIVHRDYTDTFIQMKVYNERITLWNSGTLPPDYTVEKLWKEHESRPRNKLIANVFYMAGFIEAWGRGYEKIYNAFKKEHLKMPVFEEARGGFLVTIKREKFISTQAPDATNQETSQETIQKTSQKTSQKIIEQILKNKMVTIDELAEECGITVAGVKWQLQQMQQKNLIRRVGSKKGGYWEITNT